MEKFSFSDKIRILIIHQTSAFTNLTLTLLYGLMRRRMMIGVIKNQLENGVEYCFLLALNKTIIMNTDHMAR